MIGGVGYGSYALYNGYGVGTVANQTTKVTAGQTESVSPAELKRMKRTGAVECEACKNRKYQDGSNEGDVSFKTPGHIDPGSSAAKVMAHEQEHVANAYEKAAKNDGEVVSATVKLKTAVCSECGRSYVSGGVTNTMIKYNESTPYGREAKSLDAANLIGQNIDIAV